MYYKCERCNKVWYYFVRNCIFCKERLTRIIPKSFTVKALTKVNSPSFGHEKVPYYVLLLEDEFGNTHAKKSYREYKIEDKLDYDKDKISVAAIRYDSYEAVEKTIRLLDNIEINNESKIIIKVHLLDFNFSLLQSLLEFLIEKGVNENNMIITYNTEEEDRLLSKFNIESLGIKTKIFDRKDIKDNLFIDLASIDAKDEENIDSKSLYFLFSIIKNNTKNQHTMLFASFDKKILNEAIEKLNQNEDVNSITGEEIEIIKDSLKA